MEAMTLYLFGWGKTKAMETVTPRGHLSSSYVGLRDLSPHGLRSLNLTKNGF